MDTNEIIIRPCTVDDVADVHALQLVTAQEGLAYGYVPATRDAIVAALGPFYLVAQSGDRVVGFITGSGRVSDGLAVSPAGEQYLEVDDLYIHPDWRRRRIGASLLDTLLDAARAQGYTKAILYSAVKDIDPVIKFYRRNGFKTWFVEFFKEL